MPLVNRILPSPWLIGLLAIQILFLAIAFFNGDLPFAALSRDPIVAAKDYGSNGSYFYGALSSIGVLLWFAAAAVLLFAAMLCFNRRSQTAAQHLTLMAFVSVILGLDDLFMLHEYFLPDHGVPEKLVFAVYGAVTACSVFLTRTTMLSDRNRASLLLAGGLFGFSIVIDVLHDSGSSLHYLAEDGSKFLGMGAWAHYNISAALKLASPASQPVEDLAPAGLEHGAL